MAEISIEKVIKGLGSCAKWMSENDNNACDNCPYHHSHFSYDDNNCIAAVNNDAIALLKEPVKPKMILHGVDGISYADCPNCGKQINDSDNHHCCESCGQGIKWD